MNEASESEAVGAKRRSPAPPWRLFDVKCRRHWPRYLAQSLMAITTMMLILLFLDAVKQTVLIASLGASTFIAFAAPHMNSARPRYLLGGYLVGTLAGCGLGLAAVWLAVHVSVDAHTVQIICGAVATGLAFLLMVITDTEHPPAAALALGYVLNEWDGLTLVVVFAGIAAIVAVKELTKRFMMDLV